MGDERKAGGGPVLTAAQVAELLRLNVDYVRRLTP
jgi:hypothetical protein